MIRYCAACGGGPIINCSGFALARDVIRLLDGDRSRFPRELCGRCGAALGLASWLRDTGQAVTPALVVRLAPVYALLAKE